jgi:hypothetical protein
VNTTGWLKGLRVTRDGAGIVSHAAFTLPVARHGSLVTAGARTRFKRHRWNIDAAGTA